MLENKYFEVRKQIEFTPAGCTQHRLHDTFQKSKSKLNLRLVVLNTVHRHDTFKLAQFGWRCRTVNITHDAYRATSDPYKLRNSESPGCMIALLHEFDMPSLIEQLDPLPHSENGPVQAK